MTNYIEEDEIKRKQSFSHYGGRASAFEDIEKDLKQRAGILFSNGNDKEAELVRQLSISIGKRALENRIKQKDFEAKFSGGA